MREYRGNVSVAYQLEQPDRVAQRKKMPQKRGLSAGEKMLYLVSILIVVAVSTLILSRYAAMAELNLQASDIQRNIAQLQEENQQLESETKELMRPERIRRFAEDRGMIQGRSNKLFLQGKETR